MSYEVAFSSGHHGVFHLFALAPHVRPSISIVLDELATIGVKPIEINLFNELDDANPVLTYSAD